ncbi:MAG: hypothetical protein GY811_27545 [Myxococcales bacterium]|nr:hypothetical protein [Myxococcales bacterium]
MDGTLLDAHLRRPGHRIGAEMETLNGDAREKRCHERYRILSFDFLAVSDNTTAKDEARTMGEPSAVDFEPWKGKEKGLSRL